MERIFRDWDEVTETDLEEIYGSATPQFGSPVKPPLSELATRQTPPEQAPPAPTPPA
jgi:hypothetical protein